MASPSVLTKDAWADAIQQVISLSSHEIQRSAALEDRVSELEAQLRHHQRVYDATVQKHSIHLSAVNRQLSRMEHLSSANVNPSQLVLCVIDGDQYVFEQHHLANGHQGGLTAARQLTRAIADYLGQDSINSFQKLSFWSTVFFNKSRLTRLVSEKHICTVEQLESFMAGFSEASASFLVVDVGDGLDATHSKISKYLRTYVPLPQMLRLFLAVRNEDRYMPTFANLEIEQVLDKVVLMRDGHSDPSVEPSFELSSLDLDGIFMDSSASRHTSSPPMFGFQNTGLMSPDSPTRIPEKRVVDLSLPLHKQNPPPCNEHYLMVCSKGVANCKYSHDYVLTQEQLGTLAANAKKAPCNWLKNGVDCPYGDNCCWGHTCPNGSRCYHLSKGKCWFKGAMMHPPMSPPRTPVSSI